MPTCTILIGIPTSGKNYWLNKNHKFGMGVILSCDDIRDSLSKEGKYTFSYKNEENVWKIFYESLNEYKGTNLVVNNTNCKAIYINKIKEILGKEYTYTYIWFDIPLWKAYIRNIKRWIFEDKWIPISVLKNFNKNYDKLKKKWKN